MQVLGPADAALGVVASTFTIASHFESKVAARIDGTTKELLSAIQASSSDNAASIRLITGVLMGINGKEAVQQLQLSAQQQQQKQKQQQQDEEGEV